MKKSGHLSSFHVPFLSYGLLNYLRKCVFAILCYLREKSKSIKAIYIYASERSCYTLSKNRNAHHAMANRFADKMTSFFHLPFPL